MALSAKENPNQLCRIAIDRSEGCNVMDCPYGNRFCWDHLKTLDVMHNYSTCSSSYMANWRWTRQDRIMQTQRFDAARQVISGWEPDLEWVTCVDA